MDSTQWNMTIPAVWLAFIPAKDKFSDIYIDFFKVREFSPMKTKNAITVQLTWTNGDIQMFTGDRAARLISEFDEYLEYIRNKQQGDRQQPT